jgi:hypothetical protein
VSDKEYVPVPAGLPYIDDPETIIRKMLEGEGVLPDHVEAAVKEVLKTAKLYAKVNPLSGGKLSRQTIASLAVGWIHEYNN